MDFIICVFLSAGVLKEFGADEDSCRHDSLDEEPCKLDPCVPRYYTTKQRGKGTFLRSPCFFIPVLALTLHLVYNKSNRVCDMRGKETTHERICNYHRHQFRSSQRVCHAAPYSPCPQYTTLDGVTYEGNEGLNPASFLPENEGGQYASVSGD